MQAAGACARGNFLVHEKTKIPNKSENINILKRYILWETPLSAKIFTENANRWEKLKFGTDFRCKRRVRVRGVIFSCKKKQKI